MQVSEAFLGLLVSLIGIIVLAIVLWSLLEALKRWVERKSR